MGVRILRRASHVNTGTAVSSEELPWRRPVVACAAFRGHTADRSSSGSARHIAGTRRWSPLTSGPDPAAPQLEFADIRARPVERRAEVCLRPSAHGPRCRLTPSVAADRGRVGKAVIAKGAIGAGEKLTSVNSMATQSPQPGRTLVSIEIFHPLPIWAVDRFPDTDRVALNQVIVKAQVGRRQ